MSLAGIFPSMGTVSMPRLITEDPMTAGYRSEDEFQRRQARDAVALDTTRFQLEEMRRRASEAQGLDIAQRETLGDLAQRWGLGDAAAFDPGAAIRGPVSQSAALPSTPGPVRSDASYATAPVTDLTRSTDFDPNRYLSRIVGEESGGNPNARPIDRQTGQPRSSALGLGQFTSDTWLGILPTVAQRLGQDYAGLSRDQLLDLRRDPDLSKAAILALAEQSRPTLERALGGRVGENELRLAHGFGAQGAINLLKADPSAPAALVVGAAAARANPEMIGTKSVGELLRGFGIQSAAPAYAPAAAMGHDTMSPQVTGMMPSPQQQARGAQIEATPGYRDAVGNGIQNTRALAGSGVRSETSPPLSVTDLAAMSDTSPNPGPGSGLPNGAFSIAGPAASGRPILPGQDTAAGAAMGASDVLLNRFTDPRMKAYASRLSQTPGGGAMLEKLVSGQLSDMDKFGLEGLKAAANGQPEVARMYFAAIGKNVDPALLGNAALAKHLFEIGKTLSVADPVYGGRFATGLADTGDPAAAIRAAGVPTRKSAFTPVTVTGPDGQLQIGAFDPTTGSARSTGVSGYAGGRGNTVAEPAEARMIKFMVTEGIARDAGEAWQKLRTARNDPAKLYMDALKSLEFDGRPEEEKRAAARGLAEEALQFSKSQSGGLRSIAPPTAESSTPTITGGTNLVPGGGAQYRLPDPSDPLGLR